MLKCANIALLFTRTRGTRLLKDKLTASLNTVNEADKACSSHIRLTEEFEYDREIK